MLPGTLLIERHRQFYSRSHIERESSKTVRWVSRVTHMIAVLPQKIEDKNRIGILQIEPTGAWRLAFLNFKIETYLSDSQRQSAGGTDSVYTSPTDKNSTRVKTLNMQSRRCIIGTFAQLTGKGMQPSFALARWPDAECQNGSSHHCGYNIELHSVKERNI